MVVVVVLLNNRAETNTNAMVEQCLVKVNIITMDDFGAQVATHNPAERAALDRHALILSGCFAGIAPACRRLYPRSATLSVPRLGQQPRSHPAAFRAIGNLPKLTLARHVGLRQLLGAQAGISTALLPESFITRPSMAAPGMR